jgi:hypothetical protein
MGTNNRQTAHQVARVSQLSYQDAFQLTTWIKCRILDITGARFISSVVRGEGTVFKKSTRTGMEESPVDICEVCSGEDGDIFRRCGRDSGRWEAL